MTLPNILTLSRIGLTVLFLFVVVNYGALAKILALGIFLVASFTDFYDGYYAKKHDVVTNFGKIMDPIADKFLILTAFFVFVRLDLITLWMFVIIFVRECLVTGLRLFAMRSGRVLAAEQAGKIKTVIQFVTVCFIMIFMVLRESKISTSWSDASFRYWQGSITGLMVIVIILTLYSGIHWLWKNRDLVHVR